MESGFIQTVLDWTQANPLLAMLAAFVFAFFESLVIVGLFIPGMILLFTMGAMMGTDGSGLAMLWLGASLGAMAGDGASYWLGYRHRDRLAGEWPFKRFPELLERGRALIDRHGGKSILLGRFIGPLRPVVPVVAGMLAMPPRRFFSIAIPACILWVPCFLLPGAAFGTGLMWISEFGSRLAVIIGIVVVGLWLSGWLVRLIYETAARRSAWWLKSLVGWTRRHPVIGRLVNPVLQAGRRQVLSVALLGVLLLCALAGLLAALLLAPVGTPAWDAERVAAGVAASLRNHFADPVFVVLSLSGEIRALALLALITALLLAMLGRRNASVYWLAAIAGAWLMGTALNLLMRHLLDPPAHETLGQIPHVGFTLTTVMFGFFAVMVAKDLRARSRKWPYLTAWTAVALTGFAHFYLGRASVSGLFAGLTLGVCWVALVGIAYRQRSLPRRHPLWLAIGFSMIFLATAAWQISHHYQQTLTASRLSQPQRLVAMDQWWQGGWQELRERRSRVGRASVQRFDLQLAAPLDQVRSALRSQGWSPLPEVTPGALALAFSGPSRRADLPTFLPHLPRDFNGRPEDLALRLLHEDGRVTVLRLWHSGVTLTPGNIPVWLGQIRQAEVRNSAWLLSLWRPVRGADPVEMLRLDSSDQAWQSTERGLWLIGPARLLEE